MESQVKKPTRPWHSAETETESIDQVYKSGLENRSIDQVYRPGQTRSIDQVKNLVDKPETANQVYKPVSIMLENLRGNPLRVIRFLFTAIDNFQEKTTRKIQLAEMMQSLEITRDSARTGIKFLNKSGLISTLDYFAGLNGWTRYKIQDEIFNEIWSINQVYEFGSKPGLYCSSSVLNTTTNMNQVSEIDISPLEHVGFKQSHIQQVIKMNSPESLQESINQFAFDLENNKKWKDHKSPLTPFMAVLKRSEPWTAENYVSPKERALRKQLESRKQELERTSKMLNELLDAEFEIWSAELSSEKISEILTSKRGMPREVGLKLHFKENHWPEIKRKLSST